LVVTVSLATFYVLMADLGTLIQIRERAYLELLDLALLVIRKRPRPLLLAAAGGIAPWALFNSWLMADQERPPTLWLLLYLLEAPWATAPLTVVLGGLMFGQVPGLRAVLGRLARALPTLVFVHLVVRSLLCLTIVLIRWISGRLWFASEVILLEQTTGFKALRRCGQLSSGRSGEFFAHWLGQLGFGLVFTLCFWIGTGSALEALFHSEVTWHRPLLADLGNWRFQLGAWIAIAFFAVARFFIYIDQRIRIEGWELRLRLQAAGRDVAEGRS
jgi:hypothetical protein